jgi:tetratricopeptide (TPR) repeat protein
MKHFFTFLLTLVVTLGWAQKKELKQAQKLYKSAKISEAKASLDANQALLESAEMKYAAPYNLLRAQIALAEEDYQASYDYLQLAQKDSGLSSKTSEQKRLLIAAIINAAIEQSEKQEFIASAKNLYLSYVIDPEANVDYLYYAASNAVNASEYELSLKYYQILKDIKYTGITTKRYVTEVANNTEIEVTESEYSIYQKSKDYTNFRTEDTESKFPEIVKNIALIYNQLGEKEKAIEAVIAARAESPNDLGLILTEANIYIELGEKEKFKVLMGEAIAQDPENANLYYNLGVVTADLGDNEKAIELDPSMEDGYLNLVALILKDETSIVEEMNSLGNSRADNAKYDILKEKRESVYSECVPILKKLISISDSNQEAARTLMNIYATLGNNEGFMEMKKLLE